MSIASEARMSKGAISRRAVGREWAQTGCLEDMIGHTAQMRNIRRQSACQHGLVSVRQTPQQQEKRCCGLPVRRGLTSHANGSKVHVQVEGRTLIIMSRY